MPGFAFSTTGAQTITQSVKDPLTIANQLLQHKSMHIHPPFRGELSIWVGGAGIARSVALSLMPVVFNTESFCARVFGDGVSFVVVAS
jgi:hypothetical protein